MNANFVSIGALCAAVGILFGAFGAHSLRAILGPPELLLWETATRYWLIGALGMGLFGLSRASQRTSVPGWFLLGGSLLFTGSLLALALGAPRGIGALTPLGGLGLVAGFLSFAWVARHS